jgi:hypothetical protein
MSQTEGSKTNNDNSRENNYNEKVAKYRGKYYNLIKQCGGKTLNHFLLERDVKNIVNTIPFDVILIGSGAISYYLKDLYCATKDEIFLDELDKLKVNDLDFIHGNGKETEKMLAKEIGDFTTNNTFGKNVNYKRKTNDVQHSINEFDLSFVPDINDSIMVDGVKLLNLDILSEFYKKSSPCKTPNSEKIRILNIILEKVRGNGELKKRYNVD